MKRAGAPYPPGSSRGHSMASWPQHQPSNWNTPSSVSRPATKRRSAPFLMSLSRMMMFRHLELRHRISMSGGTSGFLKSSTVAGHSTPSRMQKASSARAPSRCVAKSCCLLFGLTRSFDLRDQERSCRSLATRYARRSSAVVSGRHCMLSQYPALSLQRQSITGGERAPGCGP